MNRRQFIQRSSLLTAGALLPLKGAFAAYVPSGFTPLRRNVGYFSERGGTIGWLVSPENMAVIDSQYPESARNCLNGLRDRSDASLDLLMNTHHHGDHTAGNTVFKGVAEMIVAHKNVPRLMKKGSGQEGEQDGQPGYPTTTFSRKWKTDLADETVHATHYGPGHTGGDSVIYFEKANVVHMGDLVFNRMNPYTDRPSGASIRNWITILNTVADEYPRDALYIFGHGKPEAGVTGTKEDLAVMKNYLSAVIEYVQKGIEQGKTKDEITAKKELEGFEHFLYADFWTLPDNLGVAYEELTQS